MAVYLQASGAQRQGYWDTVGGRRLLSQQLTWRRTILLDARDGHPQPLNAEGEEREGFDNQSNPSAFHWCLNISPFFFSDINDVKCIAGTKWQFGVLWGKIFCWKFLISLCPSWDVDTWLELFLSAHLVLILSKTVHREHVLLETNMQSIWPDFSLIAVLCSHTLCWGSLSFLHR